MMKKTSCEEEKTVHDLSAERSSDPFKKLPTGEIKNTSDISLKTCKIVEPIFSERRKNGEKKAYNVFLLELRKE